MTSEARLTVKGIRPAIQANGGIDGAAATTGKSRASAGNWNNLNGHETPVVGDALLLDQVALASGHGAPITAAMAHELGGVLIILPQAEGASTGAALALDVCAIAKEFGEVSERVTAALADDHQVSPHEAAGIETELEDVLDKAMQMRAALRGLQGIDTVTALRAAGNVPARDVKEG